MVAKRLALMPSTLKVRRQRAPAAARISSARSISARFELRLVVSIATSRLASDTASGVDVTASSAVDCRGRISDHAQELAPRHRILAKLAVHGGRHHRDARLVHA